MGPPFLRLPSSRGAISPQTLSLLAAVPNPQHSTYETLRHFADSWGLLAMMVVFVCLCAWPYRRGAKDANEAAARMIFEEDDHG